MTRRRDGQKLRQPLDYAKQKSLEKAHLAPFYRIKGAIVALCRLVLNFSTGKAEFNFELRKRAKPVCDQKLCSWNSRLLSSAFGFGYSRARPSVGSWRSLLRSPSSSS
jgi:hypothetical protein